MTQLNGLLSVCFARECARVLEYGSGWMQSKNVREELILPRRGCHEDLDCRLRRLIVQSRVRGELRVLRRSISVDGELRARYCRRPVDRSIGIL